MIKELAKAQVTESKIAADTAFAGIIDGRERLTRNPQGKEARFLIKELAKAQVTESKIAADTAFAGIIDSRHL